jgi:prepilin-type N-terminal cleavage/methylation domain-containing protein
MTSRRRTAARRHCRLSTRRRLPTRGLPTLSRSRGFTLIELLLASVLVSVAAIMMFSALRTAVAARDACARTTEPTRTGDLAFEIIRKDFENAVPPTGILAAAFTGNDYPDDRGGEADEVTFFTTAPGPQHVSGDGEVRRVQYYITSPDGPQGERVLVRKVVHDLLAQEEPPGDEEIVLRGIAGFSLQYYDTTAAGLVTSWDSTQRENALPTMVQVGIDIERPDPTLPAGSPPRVFRFTRHVQISCAVATQSNVQGLSGGGLGGSGGGF